MKFGFFSNIKVALYGFFATMVLFIGFFTDFWKVANEQWFLGQNYDMESFVVGRLVESRQNGIFSFGGFTGNGSPDENPAEFSKQFFDDQYHAYQNDLSFVSFTPYESQIGGQGMFFSILDKLIPLSPPVKLQIFHALTSLLSALTLTLIVLWFLGEFGLLVSLSVLTSMFLSPWLVVFGGKLWWSMWSFYLPMVVIMYHMEYRKSTSLRPVMLGILVFSTIFLKCLFSGYEYITTTLIMMVVPLIYSFIKQGFGLRKVINASLIAVVGSCLAIVLSMSIQIIQIASVEGNLLKGINQIKYSFEKRTYGGDYEFSPLDAESLKSNPVDVALTYLRGSYFGPIDYLSTSMQVIPRLIRNVKYIYLIFLFWMASVFWYAFWKMHPTKENDKRFLALVTATWFSLLAPLSWFLIFKGHSYIHTHMNFIVWQMPFTLFGFGVCGLLLQVWINGIRHKIPSPG